MTHLQYFYEISKIPRPSGSEEKIAQYLCDFAKKHGLEYYTDENRNVLINKPASTGYENAPAFCLQGHTDMVCEKEISSTHDFTSDPIQIYEKDGKLSANGTTLGADDGAAIGIMLALLESTEPMPRLQCLFTAEEETGLFGASSFDYSKIYADYMINIDGEEEGEILTSCAGGLRVKMQKQLEVKNANNCVKITVSGLAGGHSGSDINKNRANASVIMLQLIKRAKAPLCFFEGGSKENAITPYAVSVVEGDAEQIRKCADELVNELKGGLCPEDMNLEITVEPTETLCSISLDETMALCNMMQEIKHGVIRMSDDMEGFVSTSANVGVVKIENGSVYICVSVRSENDDEKYAVYEEYDAVCRKYGFSCEQGQGYPGWRFRKESRLRTLYAKAYKQVTGKDIKISAIHAGLECGLISGALPSLDIIAIGPDMSFVHTTAEYIDISSFDRVFETVRLCLKTAIEI